MKFDLFLSILLLGASAVNAVALPEPDIAESTGQELWKRKGGGGGGARGGGGGGGSSSSSSSSRGGSSSSSSSSSRPGSPGFAGSGAPRAFGGGRYYGAGAATPYKAGSRSPSGILPLALVGAAALAFWPGVWLWGAYQYHYPNHYHFHNDTANNDEDLPVICACDPYNPCGCDANNDTSYIQDLVGNGDYKSLNQSLVTVAEVNGQKTILINGTLPNGTEAPVPADESGARSVVIEALGFWPMAAAVVVAVFMT